MSVLTGSKLPPISLDEFRHGMRRLTAGVSLITTEYQGEKHGLIATSVSSLTAEPPSLLVCVNRSSSSHDPITGSGVFAVNVLASHHDDICAQFSQSARRADRFQSGEWHALKTGVPALKDALVTFDCQLEKIVEWSTHSILLAHIVGIHLLDGELDPMVYFNSGFHTLKP